jgi:hypothetical protein
MARTLADLAPPAVDIGAPFILLYTARSLLIAIYFVFTCSCLYILVLMYLTCSSHDRPLFLVYTGHGVRQNKALSFDCHSCPCASLRCLHRVVSLYTHSVEVSTPLDFFPRHFSLRFSRSFYHLRRKRCTWLSRLSHITGPLFPHHGIIWYAYEPQERPDRLVHIQGTTASTCELPELPEWII